MSKIDDGGPAFPTMSDREYERSSGSVHALDSDAPGMALRDWFAGKAVEGFCQSHGWIGYVQESEHRQHLLSTYARDAYAVADAMIAERNKTEAT